MEQLKKSRPVQMKKPTKNTVEFHKLSCFFENTSIKKWLFSIATLYILLLKSLFFTIYLRKLTLSYANLRNFF